MRKILLHLFSTSILLSSLNSYAGNVPAPSITKGRSNAPRSAHHVVGGDGFTVEIRSGQIWSWGLGNKGQLGTGNDNTSLTPVRETTNGTDWVDINAGAGHVLAVKSDGTLWSWGDNSFGQLGRSTSFASSNVPGKIGNDNDWVSIGCGINQSYAIKADGSLWVCGSNQNGALGLNISNSSFTATSMSHLGNNNNWRNVSGGNNHVSAIQSDGTLWTWGNNSTGQLGSGGTPTQSNFPLHIGSSTNWISVETGDNYVMGLTNNGKLYGWGQNTFGQLGDGTTQNHTVPTPIGGSENWMGMSCGQRGASDSVHTLGVTADGKVFAWGNDHFGQLGIGAVSNSPHPTPIQISSSSFSSISKIVNVECGYGVSYAITAKGRLYAWGNNQNGQIGDGTVTQALSPKFVSIVPIGWSQLAGGGSHTAALKSDGNLWTMGDNTFGQLGDGTNAAASTIQVQVLGGEYTRIASGLGHSLAIQGDGSLWSWGQNSSGQLGNGVADGNQNSTPVQIGIGSLWIAVSCGDNYSMGIKSDGTLWAWGLNDKGQFGTGAGTISLTAVTSPVQVDTAHSWVDVECGADFTLAIKSDGKLWSWGNNSSGQLGIGSSVPLQSSPALVTAISTHNWISVAAGGAHAVGITSNGNIYSWGDNAHGQLGDGGTTPHNAPMIVNLPVTGLKGLTAYCGSYHSFVIANDGTIYGWGENSDGQLGLGNFRSTTIHTSPEYINYESDVILMGCGHTHSLLIHSDRSTICMTGLNNFGQLGDGTYNSSSLFECVVTSLPCNAPSIPTLSSSAPVICGTGSSTLSIASGSLNDATQWKWYRAGCGGVLVGSGTSVVVSPTTTTTYYARGEGGCVIAGSCANISVNVNSIPNVGITVAPSSTICAGSSVTLTGTGAASYAWSGGVVNGGAFAPGSTSTYTVTGTTSGCSNTAAQTINVTPAPVCQNGGTVNASCGCNCPSGFTGALCQTVVGCTSAPAVPGAISGPAVICQLATAVYSVAAVSGANNYIWQVPGGITITSGQGTSSINVRIPGGTLTSSTITVAAQNACGTSDTATIMVTKKAGYTGPISGPISLCGATTAAYSVLPVFGATTYTWTLPSGITLASGIGTNSITVNVAATFLTGNISVVGSNACGAISGASNSLSVQGKVPLAPTIVSGPTAICGLTTANYTATAPTGGTGYSWNLPSGFSYISGSGTSSIVVSISGYTSGNIAVAGTNGCGTGALRTLTLTKAPASAGAISGPTFTCGLSSATYSVSGTAGYTYIWAVPAGMTIAGATNGASINVNIASPPTGTISVMANNGCANSPVSNLAVTKSIKPGAISGPIVVCGLTTISYSIAQVTGATSYSWQVPAGMTIASGQGSTFITVNVPLTMASGLVKVYGISPCGTSAFNSVTIGACSNPIAPGIENTGVSFSLYPNPVADEFTIDITSEASKIVTEEIYDVLGNKVVVENHSITEGQSSIKTNIEHLSKGIYFVRLTDKNNAVLFTQRVIKE